MNSGRTKSRRPRAPFEAAFPARREGRPEGGGHCHCGAAGGAAAAEAVTCVPGNPRKLILRGARKGSHIQCPNGACHDLVVEIVRSLRHNSDVPFATPSAQYGAAFDPREYIAQYESVATL
eukprot:7382936-Prymnesium_polylepis.1